MSRLFFLTSTFQSRSKDSGIQELDGGNIYRQQFWGKQNHSFVADFSLNLSILKSKQPGFRVSGFPGDPQTLGFVSGDHSKGPSDLFGLVDFASFFWVTSTRCSRNFRDTNFKGAQCAGRHPKGDWLLPGACSGGPSFSALWTSRELLVVK